MASPTVPLVPETIELRTGVDWDTYVRLNDSITTGAIRLTYHRGTLEIMGISQDHDIINRLISDLFTSLAAGLDINFRNVGGTTHRDERSQVGFEGDTTFYVTNLDCPFQPGYIVLPRDPAPGLVIEVDISRSSMNKMAAYSAIGVREGWRHHAGRLHIFSLAGGKVKATAESVVLPGLTSEDLNALLAKADEMPRQRWALYVIEWARGRKK